MSPVLGKPGSLYIVATPIGNLSDITDRAKDVLANVDLIAAEDTRHSAKLFAALGLSKPLFSLHEHNEFSQATVMIEKLQQGSNIALISDAGTPLISDPGFRLVDLAHENKIKVIPIPGASSVTAALCASGISTATYRFIGFLPSKPKQRQQALKDLHSESATLVFFESPHRIINSLADFVEIFGSDRKASYCRELTKQFETIFRATLGEIKNFVDADQNQRRGEIVLVISGVENKAQQTDSVDYQPLLEGMLEHMSVKDAASLLARAFNHPRKYFYDMGLILKNSS